jgi:hypothetical protein
MSKRNHMHFPPMRTCAWIKLGVVLPPQVLRTNFELKIIHTQTHSRLSSNSRDRTPGFPDRFRAGLKTDTTHAMMRASGSLVMAADSPIALLHPVFFCILLLPVSSRLIQYSYIHLLHVTTDSVNIVISTPTEPSLASSSGVLVLTVITSSFSQTCVHFQAGLLFMRKKGNTSPSTYYYFFLRILARITS